MTTDRQKSRLGALVRFFIANTDRYVAADLLDHPGLDRMVSDVEQAERMLLAECADQQIVEEDGDQQVEIEGIGEHERVLITHESGLWVAITPWGDVITE